MAIKIGPVIGVEGERAFRAAFRDMIAQAQLFDNEMNKLTATFQKNDSALDRNRRIQEQLTRQISQQKTNIGEYKQMLERAQATEVRRAEAYEKQKERVATLNKHMEVAKGIVEDLKKQYGEESEEVKNATANYERMQKTVNQANKDLETAEVAVYRSQETTKHWQMELNNAEVELNNLIQKLKELPNSLQVVGKAMQEHGEKISSFGDKLTRYVTTPLAGLGAASLKAASDFRDGMAKVYTIADETKVSMEDMAEGLKDLSNATGFGLDDLAEAAYQAVSASVATEDALGFLTEATKLARAGFTDVTTSVDILSTVINSYGKEAYTAAQISDILLKTQNDGKTIVNDLAQRMGLIIPMAKNYGVSLEQIAAGYATMTKQGVKTEQATTYFRAMFTQLEKEGSDVDKVLTSLTDKTFKQLMDSGKSISDVLKILWEYVDEDSEAFQRLFGQVRATQAVAALTADNFAVLDKELGAMANTTGLVDEALETLQTPGLQARKTLNRLKNTLVEIGETLMIEFVPIFEDVVEAIKNGTEWFANLDDSTKKSIVNIGLMVTALGPALKIFGTAETILGKGVSGIGKLLKALNGLNPAVSETAKLVGTVGTGTTSVFGTLLSNIPTVLGIAAAFMAVVGGLKLLSEHNEAVARSMYGLTTEEQELISRTREMKTAWDEMTSANNEQTRATQNNIDHINYLKDRYNELVDESGNVKEEHKALADVIIRELSSALGMEEEEVRKLIEANGKFGESIDEVIEKQRRQGLLQVYQDDYLEATKNITQYERDQISLEAQLADKKKALDDAQANYNTELERHNRELKEGRRLNGENDKALASAQQQLRITKEAYKEMADQVDENREAIDGMNTVLSNYEGLLNSSKGETEDFNYALLKTQEGFITAEQGSQESLYRQYKNIKDTYEDMKKAVDSGSTYITDEQLAEYERLKNEAENELTKFGWMNKSKMAEASNQAKQGWQEKQAELLAKFDLTWGEGVKKLNNGVSKFKKPGSDSAEKYASGVASQVSAVGSAATSLLTKAKTNATGSLYSEGANLAQGYANGIWSKIGAVGAAAAAIVSKALSTVPQKQQSGSPSKITTQFGKDFGEGYVIGIKSMADMAREASAYLANNAIDTSAMITGYSPNNNGDYYNSTRTISAPISVNVSVNGNVDDYDALADAVADKIATEVVRKGAVFG